MRCEGFECFAHARQQFKKLRSVAGQLSRFLRQTRNEHFRTRQDLFLTDTRIAERFDYDLQISHARDFHLAEPPGSTKDLLEHRNRVLLITADLRGTNQRPIDVPKQYSHHSITASISPAFMVSPGFTLIDTTTPSRGDFISFCIFIASTTTTPAPFSIAAPASVSTRTTLPCMGAMISAPPG